MNKSDPNRPPINTEGPDFSQAVAMLQQSLGASLTTSGGKKNHYTLQPHTLESLQNCVSFCHNNHLPLQVGDLPLSSLYFSEKPRLILDVSSFNAVHHFPVDDLLITVDTGMTALELQKECEAQNLQYPLWFPDNWTQMDILLSDQPSLETGFLGYPRDTVTATEWLSPDGGISHYGGEVVKNVSGYDLNKCILGSHYQLGLITRATLKLAVPPEAEHHYWLEISSLEEGYGYYQSLSHADKSEGTTPFSLKRCELLFRNSHSSPGTNGLFFTLSDSLDSLEVQAKRLPGDVLKLSKASARKWMNTLMKQSSPIRRGENPLSKTHELTMTLEVCLPPLKVFKWLHSIVNRPEIKPFGLQWRMAAGLIYFHLSCLEDLSSFPFWFEQKEALYKHWGGTLRMIQAPDSQGQLMSELNQAPHPLTRQLMQQWVKTIDPHQIFTG
ncbi:MAG: hypothetical protein K2X01_08055 [Cyanobacteria bacterium]|nr:hypothetical protein [Cyanobacteriota bacterium]